jgi:hypothetical protein
MWILAGAAVAFAGVGVFVASTQPDGIERLTLPHVTAARPVAGLIVLALVYLVCAGVSRAFKRQSMEREGA